MKKIICLVCVFLPVIATAQQYNDFEFNWNLDVKIDSTLPNNIWQIGQPQKTIFDSAFTPPNAIVTDTINNYPPGNYSAFQFRVDMNTLWMYPYFVVIWKQKMDAAFKIDGGWIEASYDTGATWVNVFTDTVYKPEIVGNLIIDTLANGEVGFTGTDTSWQNVMLCWGAGTGTPPFPIMNEMDIRFIFWSDSSSTGGEGWMIDNFEAYPTVIDAINETFTGNELSVHPNPVSDLLEINFSEKYEHHIEIKIFDLKGKIHLAGNYYLNDNKIKIETNEMKRGVYILQINSGMKRVTKKIIIEK